MALGMKHMEEKLAHLERMVEDLSDVVARQETELALATRRIQLLMEREASRETDGTGAVVIGDERPPHW